MVGCWGVSLWPGWLVSGGALGGISVAWVAGKWWGIGGYTLS